MGFELDEHRIPRHWLADAGGADGDGERAAPDLPDGGALLRPQRPALRGADRRPALRAQVKGFYAQEGRHAHEHERVFAMLERARVIEVKPLPRASTRRSRTRRSSGSARRSCGSRVTVALEHYTALMAEDALERRADRAGPPGAAGAAGVARGGGDRAQGGRLRRAQGGRSALLRAMPRAWCWRRSLLLGFWALGTAMLLRQEPDLGLREGLRQLRGDRKRRYPVARQGLRAGDPRVPAAELPPVAERQPRDGAAGPRLARSQRGLSSWLRSRGARAEGP
jgi:hypothetical protein